ncbi:MAG: FtsX-like permease family protein, partial [Planctomycetota bacterium]
DPARVTDIVVLGRQDDARLTQQYVLDVYTEFAAAHPDVPRADAIFIKTWEDQNATMIAAVKKETALVLFIFSFISLTAVFLVLAIFWAMVSEKTRDVGILRAIGASRTGIAWLWLRYGLAIGVVGSIFGLALAYTIVYNINTIHDWMGQALGISIWDPAVYYFTEIPSNVNHLHAAIIGLGGMLASTLGALWPALRAARMNPVRALRFE